MALTNIYTGRIQGAAVVIGNTNVLTSATSPNDTGSYVYTTTIPTLQVAGYPPGTTSIQSQNASSAILNLPSGSTIVLAQLSWLVAYESAATPVTFVTPAGRQSVSGTSVQTSGSNTWRAVDVTSAVAAGQSGTYTVGAIPGNLNPALLEGAVNWSLLVIYQNTSLPLRYINFNTGLIAYPPVTYNFSNIETPISGAFNAYYFVTGTHGQYSDLTKIQVGPTGGPYSLIGNTSNPWNGLSPYNRQVSFLPSNICIADPQSPNVGLLDTTGTFGTYNINPYGASPPTIPPAARVMFDITAVSISSFMTNGQNTLTTQISGGTGGQVMLQGVQIDINGPMIIPRKAVDKTTAFTGDILTYTATIANTGTLKADSVVFLDTLPSSVSFVSSSFNFNGVTIPSVTANPISYNMGTISIGGINTITFKVLATATISTTTILNSFETNYVYTPIVGQTFSGSVDSNTVSTVLTPLNNNLSSITKAVDKYYASVGDVLNYTITIPNTGNATATNVIFYDTIPANTTFNTSSLYVNGVLNTGDLQSGINIGTILAGGITTINFSVTTTSIIPSPNRITNNGIVNYLSTLGTTLANISNTVVTTISTAIISSTKSVTPTNCSVGDTIYYTIVLKNTGNTTAQNVVFTDTPPNGTSLVSNSLAVNGATIPGGDPSTGVSISNIGVGGVETVTFQVTATTIPAVNPVPNNSATNFSYIVNTISGATIASGSNSNTVTTFINPNNNPLKIVDKAYATIGQTLNYIVAFSNEKNVPLSSVTFIDTIPTGTTFVPGSIYVNGINNPSATITPPSGISLGTLPVGQIFTVNFNVLVTTIPSPNPIPNQAITTFNYVSDPTLGISSFETLPTNIVSTQVNYTTISTSKSVDKVFAGVGDTLTYTVTILNVGNTSANLVRVLDTIPNGTSLVGNTVTVNGVVQPVGTNPQTGINIGSINPGSTATISFQVIVNC